MKRIVIDKPVHLFILIRPELGVVEIVVSVLWEWSAEKINSNQSKTDKNCNLVIVHAASLSCAAIKASTLSIVLRLGERPSRISNTKDGSFSAARPNSVGDIPETDRYFSIRSLNFAVALKTTPHKNFPIYMPIFSYMSIGKYLLGRNTLIW